VIPSTQTTPGDVVARSPPPPPLLAAGAAGALPDYWAAQFAAAAGELAPGHPNGAGPAATASAAGSSERGATLTVHVNDGSIAGSAKTGGVGGAASSAYQPDEDDETEGVDPFAVLASTVDDDEHVAPLAAATSASGRSGAAPRVSSCGFFCHVWPLLSLLALAVGGFVLHSRHKHGVLDKEMVVEDARSLLATVAPSAARLFDHSGSCVLMRPHTRTRANAHSACTRTHHARARACTQWLTPRCVHHFHTSHLAFVAATSTRGCCFIPPDTRVRRV
jgi:hypothetical protein